MDNRKFLKEFIGEPVKPYKGETLYYIDSNTGEVKMLVGFEGDEKEEYLKRHPEYIPVNPKRVDVSKIDKKLHIAFD